jgi:hypothetical protein
MYRTTNTTRSCQPSTRSHTCQAATPSSRIGTTVTRHGDRPIELLVHDRLDIRAACGLRDHGSDRSSNRTQVPRLQRLDSPARSDASARSKQASTRAWCSKSHENDGEIDMLGSQRSFIPRRHRGGRRLAPADCLELSACPGYQRRGPPPQSRLRGSQLRERAIGRLPSRDNRGETAGRGPLSSKPHFARWVIPSPFVRTDNEGDWRT